MLPSLARLALQQADTGPIFINHDLDEVEDKAREAGVVFARSQHLENFCAICQDGFDEPEDERERERNELIVLQNCGHVYHLECLKDSVERRQNNALTCPVCQKQIHPKDRAALGYTNPAGNTNPAYNKIFVEAARDGNLANVQDLIAAGIINVDFMHEGYTALVWASARGHVPIVKELLAANANVNLVDNMGRTALMVASARDHAHIVRELLAIPNIEVDKKGEHGYTALINASSNGYLYIVKQLLAAGAKVNVADNNGGTALLYASRWGHTTVVQQLLAEPGVIIDEPRRGGDTALAVARRQGHVAVVAVLEAALEFFQAATFGNLARVRALLGDGANVTMRYNANGSTALHRACSQGHADVVAALLDAPGINVNQTDKYGYTALIVASIQGNPAIVKMLLNAPGIEVNVSDRSGMTALMKARYYGHAAVVAMLEAA